MPSTFRFTHPPNFLHFFSLTYGPVVLIDFDFIIVLFSFFGGFLVWLPADRLLSAPSDLSQFVLLFLVLFMLLLMSCAWKSFYFSPWLLSGCLLMDCWVPPPSPFPVCVVVVIFTERNHFVVIFYAATDVMCSKWFYFFLDVVWLSANGLLSAPALTSPRPQNSNAQCFNSTKHTKNRTHRFTAIQQ